MSLATKYRPQTFSDGFYGQTVVSTILKKTIENKKFKNIMLFAGSSGCGKTTMARIVAKLINNGYGNPIEIDAASANGVDQVRAIVDEANVRSLDSEYKIYIIDECHMMTTSAWNAFLKCIEEPPKYTIFIFCTTDPHKIPATILNRMQRYNFAPISPSDICAKLLTICKKEGFTNYEQACDLISRICNGCMREAITLLERCSDYSTDISIENAKLVLGGTSYETMFKLTWAIQNKEIDKIISIIDELYSNGQDIKNFINTYFSFVLDLAKYVVFNSISVTNIPTYLASESNAVVQFTTKDKDVNYYKDLSNKILSIKNAIKYDSDVKSTSIAMLINI